MIINSNLENGSYCYTKGMFNSYFDISEEPKSHNNVVTGEGSKQKAAPEKYFTCVEYEVYSVNLLGSSYGKEVSEWVNMFVFLNYIEIER